MGEKLWFTREHRCRNGVCEKTKFAEVGDKPLRPGTRRYREAMRRAEKYATEAKRELARLLNNNFTARADYHIVLEYSQEGYDRLVCRAGTDDRDEVYLTAEKEAENFIRRVRRECRARGIELRYVYITSDMDGETLEEARIHHHLVVNAEAAAICAAKWTAGGSRSTRLYGARHGDLSDLAEYMIAQARVVNRKKRYSPSRNLEKPQAMPARRARNPAAELRVPPGCELIHRAACTPGRPQNIRYYRPPEGKPQVG